MILNKQQCRELFLQKRTSLSAADHEQMTRLIAKQLAGFLANRSIGWLHSYIADNFRNEVNTTLIRRIVSIKLPQMGHTSIRWIAPRMIPGSRRMTHYIWDDDTMLVHNRWGISEPDPILSQSVEVSEIDAVLVPLLGYDTSGNRVGYGGGYYDWFLRECRPDVVKIGLSFFEPIDIISDVNEWDVRLDLCITPHSVREW